MITSESSGQDSSDMSLPLDPLVTSGTLNNGLQYFLRENAHPANRLEMRLVVNVGSVLEDDHQLGLAHFVEHMLFNGTASFPKMTLVEFFEDIGMRFGPDLNAYTSFDETVYKINVRTDSLPIVHKAVSVLSEWASKATIDPEEVERERGVIIEEWRRDRGASARMRDEYLPTLFENSRYAQRLPIGDIDILKELTPEYVREFYETWYRPELMAVVLVGDLPINVLKELVEKYFTHLTNPPNPRPRLQYSLPAVNHTRFKIVSDNETTVTNYSVHFRQSPTQNFDFRNRLLRSLSLGAFNRRLASIARDGSTSPFLWTRIMVGAPIRNQSIYSVDGQTHDDSLLTGLEAGLRELVRLSQHGLTESELTRQKRVVLAGRERFFNERNHTPSSTLAQSLVRHYLTKMPEPGIELEYSLTKDLLPTITLEEVNAFINQKLSSTDRLLVVTMPEKPDAEVITEETLVDLYDQALSQSYPPYQDDIEDGPLMLPPDTTAEIVSRRNIDEFGAREIMLENNVRIVMKPTQFKGEEVVMNSFREGGSSLYNDEEFYDATFAPAIVQRSGIGNFDQNALRAKMAGKVVRATPYVTEFSEGFNGITGFQNLETLFQLVHLYVTRPRVDENALKSFQNHQRAQIVNREVDPASAFADSLTTAFYNNHPRRQQLSVEVIDRLTTKRSLEIFRDRFSDIRGFTFVFVGSFDPDTLESLAQTYLGSLPGKEEPQSWRDVEPKLPSGIVTKTAYKGKEAKSQTAIYFHGPFEFSLANDHLFRSLQAVLDLRLTDEIREARGGTYNVSVQGAVSRIPRQMYNIAIYFGCDPDRAQELTQAVFEEIDKMKTDGPLEDYVSRVQQQQRQSNKIRVETNSYWRSLLLDYYRFDGEIFTPEIYEELINTLTVEKIREAADTWLGDQYIHVTLMPESAQ